MTTSARASQPASIRDVARLAGVSRQTVSRVINNHPSLRPETRQRVQAVIDELSYRPNPIARALGGARSRTIGVLASRGAQWGPSAAIQGIEQAATEVGHTVIITNLPDTDPASIAAALAVHVEHRVDGLVIIAPQARAVLEIERQEIAIPYVMLHPRPVAGADEPLIDQSAGARALTRHLLDLGHREIFHLAGPQEWFEAEARMQGFLREMIDADMTVRPPILGDWTAECGYRVGLELSRVRDFTAVFSANDQMALGLLHAFRQTGIDVPGEVSVVGFDDIPEAAHFTPPLTTVRQDFAELGRRCVSRLLGDGGGAGGFDHDAETSTAPTPRVIVRASTAAAR